MDDRTKLAGGVVIGYLLGRTKHTKLALAVACWLGGKELGEDLGKVAGRTRARMDASPRLMVARERVRESVHGVRRLATAEASRRIQRVSDTLHERTTWLSNANARPNGQPDKDSRDERSEPSEQSRNNGNAWRGSSRTRTT